MEKNYKIKNIQRKFEIITKQLVEYIYSENFQPGDKLPTERALSELLAVSRSSIREGIRVLELLRYVESRQGGGTFVSSPPAFIIPAHIINQSTNKVALYHYLEVGLTLAEKIAISGTQSDVTISPNSLEASKFFFENLFTFIKQIAKDLDNPFFLEIYEDIFDLLQNNHFFENEIPIDLEELFKAYQAKSSKEIATFFNNLHAYCEGQLKRI